jgi:putative transposase
LGLPEWRCVGSGLIRKETATTAITGVMIDPVTGETIDQKEPAEQLLAQAKEQGVSLVGPGGLLKQLTRNVLEAELTEHLGHEHGQTPIAANMSNGTRPC